MPRSTESPDWVVHRRRALGANLRAARLAANLTQEQVALMTGIDRATYNRIEQGHSSPLVDTLFLVADAIGVPLADLVRE